MGCAGRAIKEVGGIVRESDNPTPINEPNGCVTSRPCQVGAQSHCNGCSVLFWRQEQTVEDSSTTESTDAARVPCQPAARHRDRDSGVPIDISPDSIR